jgi:hypothetical protein
MKKWELNYAGNIITVENRTLSEMLYVNGELQDEQIGWSYRSRLWGQLPTGENIKVSVGGGWFTMQCRIFIDNKLVLSE